MDDGNPAITPPLDQQFAGHVSLLVVAATHPEYGAESSLGDPRIGRRR
jgi:hypothetical protein